MSTPGHGTGESYPQEGPRPTGDPAYGAEVRPDAPSYGQGAPGEPPNVPPYGQQQDRQPAWQGEPGYQQPYPGAQPPHPGFHQPPPGFQPHPSQPYGAYGYSPYEDPYAKSRLAAGLLGILLGWLGVHRFYLGYVGIGIAQIVATFVTFGFGGIWGLIEGILYLTARSGTYSVDATGRPLRS